MNLDPEIVITVQRDAEKRARFGGRDGPSQSIYGHMTNLSQQLALQIKRFGRAAWRILIRLIEKFDYRIESIRFAVGMSVAAIPKKGKFWFGTDGTGGFDQYCDLSDLDYLFCQLESFASNREKSSEFSIGEHRFRVDAIVDEKKKSKILSIIQKQFHCVPASESFAIRIRTYNVFFKDTDTFTSLEVLQNAMLEYHQKSPIWRLKSGN